MPIFLNNKYAYQWSLAAAPLSNARWHLHCTSPATAHLSLASSLHWPCPSNDEKDESSPSPSRKCAS